MPGWLSSTRAAAACAALLVLAGCGDNGDQFAPACPVAGIPPDAADIVTYRPTGHDVTDLQITAGVRAIRGTCKPGGKDRLAAQITVVFHVARGPAATSSSIDLPYFVAVTQGEDILDKHGYLLHVAFPSNVQSVDLQGEPVDLLLPTPQGTSGAAYRVLAGFQLSSEQLEQNRERPPQ